MSDPLHHVLIVSEGPNGEDVDSDVNWKLDGQCSPECAVWYPCERHDCKPTEDEESEGEYTRHDEAHSMIEGYWMTLSSECGLTSCDAGDESMREVAEAKGPGVWAIDTDYEGDGAWYAIAGNRVDIEVGNKLAGTQEAQA